MAITNYQTLPKFISSDANEILASAKSYYQSLVGKPLLDAQTESFLIAVLAYREKIMRDDFNDGARKMLLDFSSGTLLELIVSLLAVTRLPQQYAVTNIQFTIVTGHTGVTIPALTRVQSTDGKSTFQTNASTFVPAGTYVIDIASTSVSAGTSANSYAIGGITSILDPYPFIISAQNTDITGGGSDAESDDSLAARAKLAPAAFSNAGSYGAYKFWALSAHPSIVDCAVLGPGDYAGILGGQVYLYPLVPGIATPSAVLDVVEATCSAALRRPLCDEVIAASPVSVPYDVVFNLTLYNSADADFTSDDIAQRANDYCQARKKQMSQDVTIDQLKSIAGRDLNSVFKAEVLINGSATDLVISKIQYAYIGTITVNVTARTNG